MNAQLRFVALVLCGTCACSESDPRGAERVESGPAYLVGSRVWDDSTRTSYFSLLPSLEAGTPVDLGQALEVAGAAKLFSLEGLGWFGLGAGEEPTITRYVVDAAGRLEPQGTIDLRGQGVRSLWDTLYPVSKDKVYYPDRDNDQLIILNPSRMRVEGTLPIPETKREGFLSVYGYTPIVRGNKLIFPVGWFDWNDNDEVLPETGLVVIDAETDRVERVDVDSRCGGITNAITTDSGDTYLVSSALAGVAHRLGRLSTEPCALRVSAASDTFDPDYMTRLGELTEERIAGEPVQSTGEELFLRVFDEELATIPADSLTYETTGQPAWRWWRWNVETAQAGPVTELSPSTSDVLWFRVEGRVYGTETRDDYSETTLIELTAEGGPKRRLTVPGFVHGAARVR